MPGHIVATTLLAAVALGAVMAGLVARDRWRLLWTFGAYVLAVFTAEVLIITWPDRFWRAWFWVAKEGVFVALKLGIAVELAVRALSLSPAVSRQARIAAALILVIALGAIVAAPWEWIAQGEAYLLAAGEILPRAHTATVWLLLATVVLAAMYRVPVHPFHLQVAGSLGAYLALFGSLLRLEGLQGWAFRSYLNALEPPAYVLLACWWAYAAWRVEAAEHYHAAVERIRGAMWA